MANTLTTLAPTLYSAAQEVSAEPFGIIDSIYTQYDNKGVAKGDKVKATVAPTRDLADFEPLNISTTGVDATSSVVDVEITESKKVSWHLTGEQIRSLENGGTNQEWIRQLVAQGMRALRNGAEVDAVSAVYKGASRAAGTAGTTPFAADLSALVDVRKILRDNGAPMADLQFVCDTNAEVNLLNLGIIQQAYAAGSDEERRQGRVARQFGFRMGQSAGISKHVSTAAASYNLDVTTSAPLGTTALVLETGTAAIKVGDVFKIADGNDDYYVTQAVDTTNGESVRLLTIGRPGTRFVYLDDKALTFQGDYTPSMAFERNAIVGIMRPPLIPANPTINQMVISDGMGMSYLMLDIAQYGQRTWELHLAWGFKAVQPEHIAILMG